MSQQTQEENALFQTFCELGGIVQDLASRLGFKLQVLRSEAEPKFLNLNPADQAAVVERIKVYHELSLQAVGCGPEPEPINERKLLWQALKKLGLLPSSDLLGLIEDDHVIEVYIGDRQVYRTFNYYSLCSYSLDELESQPWQELFCREDTEVLQKMMAELQVALSERQIIKSQTALHEVSETASVFQLSFSYKMDFVAPLKDLEAGRQDCFLVAIKAKVLESLPLEARQERMKQYFKDKQKKSLC